MQSKSFVSREAMARLFRPESVAVVGASPTHEFLSEALMNFPELGFEGKVFAVNPKYDEVLGVPCYPSLLELPETPDAVLVGVNRDRVVSVIRDAAAVGAGGAVVFAIGFGEAGEDGISRQRELQQIAEGSGMAVVGPNCQGFVDFTSLTPMYMDHVSAYQPGRIALISQSGSVLTALANNRRGVRWSHIVSSGNEAVVDSADLLRFFVDAPEVGVIAAFLETVRDPRRFFAECDRARAQGKPVIVLKSGTSEAGAAAATAHTGALAAPDRLYDALFARHGVHRVSSMEALLETLIAFESDRRPSGNGLATVSGSGGQIQLILDQVDKTSLEHVPFSSEVAAELRALLPTSSATTNPVDYWGMDDLEVNYPALLRSIEKDEQVDIVVAAGDFSRGVTGRTDRAGSQVAGFREFSSESDKLLVVLDTIDGSVPEDVVADGLDNGVLILSGLAEGFEALSHLVAASRAIPPERAPEALAATQVAELLRRLRGPSSGMQASELLRSAGLPVLDSVLVESETTAQSEARRLGYPVVMKSADATLLHKTESGGVLVDLDTDAAVAAAFKVLSEVGDGSILMQPMVRGGVELIVGFTKHVLLGPFLVVGMGGIWTEIVDDVCFRPAALKAGEAREMLESLKGYDVLLGARGRPASDIDAVVELIERLDTFVVEFGDQLSEVDLNPVIVTPDGVTIVDTLVVPAES